jgi:hypothetical protein
MMDCPTASSSLAWKRSCSSSLAATKCTSIDLQKQNRPAPFCGSSRLRHWLHSSEAPKYGSELLSLYQQLGFAVHIAYMRGAIPRNFRLLGTSSGKGYSSRRM